jgi:hypothetical protein
MSILRELSEPWFNHIMEYFAAGEKYGTISLYLNGVISRIIYVIKEDVAQCTEECSSTT